MPLTGRPTLLRIDALLTPSLPPLSSISFNPQLSVPAHTIAPKAHLATASPSAFLPCAPQSIPPLCTPCVPVHPTTEHPCAPLRVPENPAALHSNLPPASGAFAGYWNVTVIPEGARHIRVAQRSHNHLGMSGHLGKLRLGSGIRRFSRAQSDWFFAALVARDGSYVLNGDGVLSPPGTYEAAGTRVVYARDAGPEETLQATGPTSQELLLQVGRPG